MVRPLLRFQDYKTLENLRVLSSSLYNCLVYTKTVDSVFRAL